MKKITLLSIVAILLVSCGTGLSSRPEKQSLIIKTYLDGFLAENPSCINNEITQKEATLKLQAGLIESMFGDSIPWLTEVPVKFESVSECPGGEGKYMVQFSHRSGGAGYYVSRDYDLSFRVLSVVDKNTISELLEERRYYISGSCHAFANYSVYTRATNISAYPGGKPSICLGTFLVENLNFTLINNL